MSSPVREPEPVVNARPQLRDEVAAYLRELIVSGQARSHERLRLSPIAAQLKTSITPVREALLLLAREGWVVREPNRGFLVASIRRQEVQDTYFVYAIVAGELAGRAAAVITPREIEKLRAMDAAIQRSTVAGSTESEPTEVLNYRLHFAIYDVADAPRLAWFVDAASSFIPRRFWRTIPGWIQLNQTEHTPLIDALAAHDVENSRRLMSEHILHAGTLVLDHLLASGFWAD